MPTPRGLTLPLLSASWDTRGQAHIAFSGPPNRFSHGQTVAAQASTRSSICRSNIASRSDSFSHFLPGCSGVGRPTHTTALAARRQTIIKRPPRRQLHIGPSAATCHARKMVTAADASRRGSREPMPAVRMPKPGASSGFSKSDWRDGCAVSAVPYRPQIADCCRWQSKWLLPVICLSLPTRPKCGRSTWSMLTSHRASGEAQHAVDVVQQD